uniref:Uncharacterized protein n=1 Tax=Bicosoecida sp. CB-2014 TaxID=1486930 RepID=A0A6T6YHJ9_9STRA|mmetsp:Transcript_5448/g.19533  ORF Transcript_5448/g.19533 Transcript_5448/m.19533 type:complete len:175 (+) Transcript_5448:313-837(+)
MAAEERDGLRRRERRQTDDAVGVDAGSGGRGGAGGAGASDGASGGVIGRRGGAAGQVDGAAGGGVGNGASDDRAARRRAAAAASGLSPRAKARVAHGFAFTKRDLQLKHALLRDSNNLRFRELYHTDDWWINAIVLLVVLLSAWLYKTGGWPFDGSLGIGGQAGGGGRAGGRNG